MVQSDLFLTEFYIGFFGTSEGKSSIVVSVISPIVDFSFYSTFSYTFSSSCMVICFYVLGILAEGCWRDTADVTICGVTRNIAYSNRLNEYGL
jgi:hypothetical protein